MATEQACTYDGYSVVSAGANRTSGWKFTPTEDIRVSAIRIKGAATYTTTAHIWRQSDATLITSVSIDCVSGSWVEQAITPVILTAGVVYIVTHNVYTTYGYYGISGQPSSEYYSDKITNVGDLRIDSQDTMPTTVTGYYLAIDFILGPAVTFKTSGTAVYSTSSIQSITDLEESYISWIESTPTGTSLLVYTACTSGTPSEEDYSLCTSGNVIPGLTSGNDLSLKILYIKVVLSTTDDTTTPSLSNLQIILSDAQDVKCLKLKLKDFNRFLNIEGQLTVAYDDTIGNLAGYGGPVESFSVSFSPADLVQKPNPNDPENMEITDVAVNDTLLRVYYTDTKEDESVEITVGVTGTLTSIDDL